MPERLWVLVAFADGVPMQTAIVFMVITFISVVIKTLYFQIPLFSLPQNPHSPECIVPRL